MIGAQKRHQSSQRTVHKKRSWVNPVDGYAQSVDKFLDQKIDGQESRQNPVIDWRLNAIFWLI